MKSVSSVPVRIAFAALTLGAFSACAPLWHVDHAGDQRPLAASTGGAVGLAAGAVIGNEAGSTTTGAAIGTALGAGAGFLLAENFDTRKQGIAQRDQRIGEQAEQIERQQEEIEELRELSLDQVAFEGAQPVYDETGSLIEEPEIEERELIADDFIEPELVSPDADGVSELPAVNARVEERKAQLAPSFPKTMPVRRSRPGVIEPILPASSNLDRKPIVPKIDLSKLPTTPESADARDMSAERRSVRTASLAATAAPDERVALRAGSVAEPKFAELPEKVIPENKPAVERIELDGSSTQVEIAPSKAEREAARKVVAELGEDTASEESLTETVQPVTEIAQPITEQPGAIGVETAEVTEPIKQQQAALIADEEEADYCQLAQEAISRAEFASEQAAALKDTRRAVRYCPEKVEVRVSAAKIFAKYGLTEEAVSECHEVLRMKPRHTETLRLLMDLEAGVLDAG